MLAPEIFEPYPHPKLYSPKNILIKKNYMGCYMLKIPEPVNTFGQHSWLDYFIDNVFEGMLTND